MAFQYIVKSTGSVQFEGIMTFQTNILSSRLTSTSFRNIQSRDSVESGRFLSIQNGYIFYIFPPSGNQLVYSTYVPLIDAENTDNTVTTIDQWLQHAQSKTEGAVFTMTRLPAVVGPFSFTLDDKTPTLGTDYSVSTGVGAYSDYTLLSLLTAGKTFLMNLTNDVRVDYLLVGAGHKGTDDTLYTTGTGGAGGEVESGTIILEQTCSYDIIVGVQGGGNTNIRNNKVPFFWSAINGGGAAGGAGKPFIGGSPPSVGNPGDAGTKWSRNDVTYGVGGDGGAWSAGPAGKANTGGGGGGGYPNGQDGGTGIVILAFSRTNPTIGSLTFPANILIGDTFNLVAPSSNSNGAFTYTSDNTSVATISGSTVTIVGNGQTIITATQAATEEYNSKIVVGVLMVANNDTSLSVFTVDGFPVQDGSTVDMNIETTNLTVVATPNYPNAMVDIVILNENSSIMNILHTLEVTVTAQNGAMTKYTVRLQYPIDVLAAFKVTSGSGTPTKTYAVTQKMIPTPLAGTISRSAADGSNTITLTLSGSTGIYVQWQHSSDGNTFTNILSATGLTYISTITATTYYRVFVAYEDGRTDFTDVLMVEFTRQNPTFGSLIFPANILIGDTFNLVAPSSNSNGAFTYTSDNTSVATISSSTVTIVGNGQTIITATQAATEEYNSKIVVGVLMVANNDTSLSVFTVDGFPVEDGRTFTLPYRKSSVSVVATPTDLNATVLITGDSNLVSGINTLTVTVTAEDCTTKIYTVKLQVPYGIRTAQKAMTIFSW